MWPSSTCSVSLISSTRMGYIHTIAVATFGNAPLDGYTGIFQAGKVLFRTTGPSLFQSTTLWLVAEEKANMVFAVKLAL